MRDRFAAKPSKEPFFDQWLTGAPTEGFNRLCIAVTDELHATASALRKRSRSAQNVETIAKLRTSIIANLAYVVVSKRTPQITAVPLAKPRTKQSRYSRSGFRQLPASVAEFEAAALLTLIKSRKHGRASTIRPSRRFHKHVRVAQLTFCDFTRAPGEETIILSRSHWNYPAAVKERELLEYQDNAVTRRLRQEMAEINQHLAGANISWFRLAPTVPDLGKRRLRRFFNLPPWLPPDEPRFDHGGRLFGGWWQSIKRTQRPFIRIDGEPIVDLDFRNLFVRLAYARAGLPAPPDGDDCYRVPSFEHYREGMKLAVSAMLFSRKTLQRLPPDVKRLLPSHATAGHVRAAILARHRRLASEFESGIGFSLMFTESRILVAVLRHLNHEGITALPMHDGIMVRRSKSGIAKMTMIEAARKETGHLLPVEVKWPK